MSEKHTPPQPNPENIPTVFMDIGANRRLNKGDVIEVDNENLAALMAQVPGIDPSKVQLRLVSFFDKEYGISEPDEQGVVTITVPAKGTDRVLADAMSDYADRVADRPYDNTATEGLKRTGEVGSEILNNKKMGAAAMGAFPQLALFEAAGIIGEHFSPGARRGRKLAKSMKDKPAFEVRNQNHSQ